MKKLISGMMLIGALVTGIGGNAFAMEDNNGQRNHEDSNSDYAAKVGNNMGIHFGILKNQEGYVDADGNIGLHTGQIKKQPTEVEQPTVALEQELTPIQPIVQFDKASLLTDENIQRLVTELTDIGYINVSVKHDGMTLYVTCDNPDYIVYGSIIPLPGVVAMSWWNQIGGNGIRDNGLNGNTWSITLG